VRATAALRVRWLTLATDQFAPICTRARGHRPPQEHHSRDARTGVLPIADTRRVGRTGHVPKCHPNMSKQTAWEGLRTCSGTHVHAVEQFLLPSDTPAASSAQRSPARVPSGHVGSGLGDRGATLGKQSGCVGRGHSPCQQHTPAAVGLASDRCPRAIRAYQIGHGDGRAPLRQTIQCCCYGQCSRQPACTRRVTLQGASMPCHLDIDPPLARE